MYVYDRANLLAQDLKECPEYLEYKKLKDEIYAVANTKELLKEYKRLRFEAQAQFMTGKEPPKETMDKLQKIGELLSFDKRAEAFLMAEYKLNQLIADVYRIIGEACEIDTDFMKE